MSLININKETIKTISPMLEKIISFTTAFHTATHVSFALTNHYPSFRKNNLLYFLYYSTDIFTFLGLYKILNNRYYLYWFYWHLIKLFDGLFDKEQNLRKAYIINNAETPSYMFALAMLKNNYSYKNLGFAVFVIARYFDLCW